jgi:hypothetical protein
MHRNSKAEKVKGVVSKELQYILKNSKNSVWLNL